MKKLTKYLFWTFGIAWFFQIIAGVLYQRGNNIAYSIVLALSMFAPLLAAIISKSGVQKLGWKLHIRKDICWILCAWFGPAALGTIGAILYFLIAGLFAISPVTPVSSLAISSAIQLLPTPVGP